MKTFYTGLVLFFFISPVMLKAQEAEPVKKKDKPVRSPFENGMVIDNQTCMIPPAKTLELLIQHRFGEMDNGISDLFGIFAPGANIRMGFNYSVFDKLMLGIGLTKKNMYTDLQIKWNILQQTRKNTVPVAVTVYGNMAIDGRNKRVFGVDYRFLNRLSYFSQIIVSRKFCEWFTLQITGSFTHYNAVDSTMNHDVIGIGFNGRVRFSPQSSLIFQYDIPLKIQKISEQREFDVAKPNFGFGYEVSTRSHTFQIFVSSSLGILPQDIYMYNNYDWTKGFSDLRFGFTITRLWGF